MKLNYFLNKTRVLKSLFIVVLLSAITINNYAEHGNVYQAYHIDENGIEYKLWVPPTTDTIKAIFLPIQQMVDLPGEDSLIREACMINDIAIVTVYNYTASGDTDFAKLVAGVAALGYKAGYPELSLAPFITFGHSTSGITAKNFAFMQTNRTLGVVQCNAVDYNPPSGHTNSEIVDIPFISIKNMDEPTGDNWLQARDLMITNFRTNGHRSILISQPGGGHFGWTSFDSKFISMFIAKCVEYQLPSKITSAASYSPVRINENAGWLVDTVVSQDATNLPASYSEYTGVKAEAYWAFDEEFATAWYQRHREEYDKTENVVSMAACTYNSSTVWSVCSSFNNYPMNNTFDFSTAVSDNPSPKYKYFAYDNTVQFSGSTGYLNSSNQTTSYRDWVMVVVPEDGTYRHGEYVFRYKSALVTGSEAPISFTDIQNKNINDPDFADDADLAGKEIAKWVHTGAITTNGAYWSIADFNGDTSFVKIVYSFRGDASYATTKMVDEFKIVNERIDDNINIEEVGVKNITDPDFNLNVTTTSGRIPELKVISGDASIIGGKVSLNGIGMVKIMAFLQGNTTYNGKKAIVAFEVQDDPLLLAGVEYASAKIYPTLTSGIVNVENYCGIVSVFNSNGAKLNEYLVENSTIDIGDLPSGLYLIKVGYKTVKVIKQ